MPKRLTAARYLWSLKHEPEKTKKCVAITTPAGYIAHRLTTTTTTTANTTDQLQPLLLGVGEASGMFPVNDATGCEYRNDWIEAFDTHVRTKFPTVSAPSLKKLLPKIRTAGDTRTNNDNDNDNNNSTVIVDDNNSSNAVFLNKSIVEPDGWLHDVKELFGSSSGILVAPAEGDQPTALAASLIGEPGMISCSFGTSVVANMVGKSSADGGGSGGSKKNSGKKPSMAAVDRFNAVNGQPISMVWLRNGTTYLNRMVDSYGGDFEALLKKAVDAPTDCGGLLALPFLDDEPGLNVKRGGTAMIVGFNGNNDNDDGNHRAGNVIKAAMVSVMFNLYLGTKQVEEAAAADSATKTDSVQAKKEIVLTGGLTKTPQTGQILADIFDRPVRLLEAADEGGAWGAALLAKYYHDCDQRRRKCDNGNSPSPPHPDEWLTFLETVEAKEQQAFYPQPERVKIYRAMLSKYQRLLQLQPQLDLVMNG